MSKSQLNILINVVAILLIGASIVDHFFNMDLSYLFYAGVCVYAVGLLLRFSGKKDA